MFMKVIQRKHVLGLFYLGPSFLCNLEKTVLKNDKKVPFFFFLPKIKTKAKIKNLRL